MANQCFHLIGRDMLAGHLHSSTIPNKGHYLSITVFGLPGRRGKVPTIRMPRAFAIQPMARRTAHLIRTLAGVGVRRRVRSRHTL